MATAQERAELRNRLRRALLNYEALEHNHAKLGYECDRLGRENQRLKAGGATVFTRDEVELVLSWMPKLRGRPTAIRRSVEDKLLDALINAQ